MIEFDNRTDDDFSIALLEEISAGLTDGDIELILTGNEEIRQINAEFRGIDKATDVLSFPYEPMPMSPLGSIVISIDFIRQNAAEYGHGETDEFALLYIHGLLHLLGFDHECDNGEMRRREKELIKRYSLPDSLIVRTEGE